MLFAYAAATVPKITVITRRAYGGSYLAMCSRDLRADMVFAWPTAEIAVMGAEGAVDVLYRKELADQENRETLRGEKIAEYRDRFAVKPRAPSFDKKAPVQLPRKGCAVDLYQRVTRFDGFS